MRIEDCGCVGDMQTGALVGADGGAHARAGAITAPIVGGGPAGYVLAGVMQAETREEARLFRVALDEQYCAVHEAGRLALRES